MPTNSSRSRSVFISYARLGSHGHAQTFYRALSNVLGAGRVYLDVGAGTIPLGADWRQAVSAKIKKVDVMLLLVDPGLSNSLVDPSDSVRFEVLEAAKVGVRIVPVRVQGAEPFASDQLDDALDFLVVANSPSVRAESSVSDVNRIVKELTGHAPGEIRVADRWDAAAVSAVLGIALLAWASWGRGRLSLVEMWLWGASLLIPMFAWWFGRRALRFPASTTGKSVAGYVGIRAIFLFVLGAVWAVLAWNQYRTPEMADRGGILVSRFEGDPSDGFQQQLLGLLREEASTYAPVGVKMDVAALPRRIDNEAAARRFGEESGAAAVLWGVVDQTTGPESIPAVIHVLFIDRPGVYQGGQGVGRSAMGSGRLLGPSRLQLTSDLSIFQNQLPGLLAGYHLYHTASDSTRLEFTEQVLTKSIDDAEGRPASDALNDTRAMLHFLRGNVRFQKGLMDAAQDDYEAALSHASLILGDLESPLYIEPINNLALIDLVRNKVDSAITRLKSSNPVCIGGAGSVACPYIGYHKGIASMKLKKYAQADSFFENVVGGALNPPGVTADDRLIADSHQSLSASAVRQAALADDHEKAEVLLQKAEQEAAKGIAALERAGVDRPVLWAVTVARVAIERGRMREALETLRSVIERAPDEPVPYELAMGVLVCMDEEDTEYLDYVGRYFELIRRQGTADPMSEFDRITGRCQSEL